MLPPFRECPTLWNSCAPRNSRFLTGGKRIGVTPATLVDPNPLSPTLSRRREREIDDHSTSRTNHYFRLEHLVVRRELFVRAIEDGADDRRVLQYFHRLLEFRAGRLAIADNQQKRIHEGRER